MQTCRLSYDCSIFVGSFTYNLQFQSNFRVRSTSVSRPFSSGLNFALETHEGTQEEVSFFLISFQLRVLNVAESI